jgi:hypothetical protein
MSYGNKSDEFYYFHGIAKSCNNCFFNKWGIFGGRCNKYPNSLRSTAMDRCVFNDWVPNARLMKLKFEKEGNENS